MLDRRVGNCLLCFVKTLRAAACVDVNLPGGNYRCRHLFDQAIKHQLYEATRAGGPSELYIKILVEQTSYTYLTLPT